MLDVSLTAWEMSGSEDVWSIWFVLSTILLGDVVNTAGCCSAASCGQIRDISTANVIRAVARLR